MEISELQKALYEQVELSPKTDVIKTQSKASPLEQLKTRARFVQAQNRIDGLEAEKKKALASLAKAEHRISDLERILKKEKDAKNLMYKEYLELQCTFMQFKDSQKAMEDPVVLRLALNQARLDLSDAQKTINDYKYDADFETVPHSKYLALDIKYSQLSTDHFRLKSSEENLRSQNRDLVQSVKEMTQQLEELKQLDQKVKSSAMGAKRYKDRSLLQQSPKDDKARSRKASKKKSKKVSIVG